MARQLRTLRQGESRLEQEPLATLSSGTITIPNHGYSVLDSTTAVEYVLDAPSAGVRKTLVSVTTTSAAVVVRMSTGTAVKVGNQAATQITMAATVAHSVDLLGINSTQWVITGNFVAAETTGIVVAAT